MNNLPISIAPDLGCLVRGCIVASNNPADLSEDMLEIAMPNGLLVCAGWEPESDPNGQYIVTLSGGMRLLNEPYETSDALDAVQKVQEIVNQYWWRSGLNVSQSEDITPIDRFEYV